jgi:putative acetyltransferase
VPRVEAGSTLRLRRVRSSREVDRVRTLFQEYARSLRIDLEFQGFAEELRSLPGAYAPPRGTLLLATWDGHDAGCVGVRPLSRRTAEMKRLFVLSRFRGRGTGRVLAERAVRAARELGYRSLRLDTLAEMTAATALYRSLGFHEVPPYRYNPVPGARFFELDLAPSTRRRPARRGTTK